VNFAHFTEWCEGGANGFNGRLERKVSDVQTISHVVDSRGGSNSEMEKAPPYQQAVRIRKVGPRSNSAQASLPLRRENVIPK
jgi:hypothetical protein